MKTATRTKSRARRRLDVVATESERKSDALLAALKDAASEMNDPDVVTWVNSLAESDKRERQT